MNQIRVYVTRMTGRKFLYMYYDHPDSGRREWKSTKTTVRRDADRVAGKWEAELREGRYRRDGQIAWEEFREQYEKLKLPGFARRTAECFDLVFNKIEKYLKPKRISDLTPERLAYFQAELRREGLAEATILGQLGYLRAALGWAQKMGWLTTIPKIERPRRARKQTLMRGRPITPEEFERLLAAVPKVRPLDAAEWRYYLQALWLSGLRLGESLQLSWDFGAGLSIELGGRRPQLRIRAEAEKGNRDRLLPLTPDFATWILEQTPEARRRGRVFNLRDQRNGRRLTRNVVSKLVAEIGRAALIVVNPDAKPPMLRKEGSKPRPDAGKKFATAHDLRRGFGTRWAALVKPAILQLLMRHESINTTMRYYVSIDADDLAEQLWARAYPHTPIHTESPAPQNAPISRASDEASST